MDKVERPSALAIPTTLLRPSSNPPIVPFPASSTRHNRNRSADFDRGTTQLLNPPKTDTRLSWSPRKFSDCILNEANENQRNG
ncbi:unnamed protein product [Anisakis simplex]|uniref:Uncharacterized protein n=1 Tax=Anisakis simplex TaxID=6269 RepID=A0A0M3JFE4_ANISI|nr:unnamed protein product [Anisakis simplex]